MYQQNQFQFALKQILLKCGRQTHFSVEGFCGTPLRHTCDVQEPIVSVCSVPTL